MMDDLERQVIEERKAKEAREIAEEVARRKEAIETQRQIVEYRAEQERMMLLRPMENQDLYTVSVLGVRRSIDPNYPLMFLNLPQTVVESLEDIFGLQNDPACLSAMVSSLLGRLLTVPGPLFREMQEYGSQVAHGATWEIAILIEPRLCAYSSSVYISVICGWVRAYEERQEAQEALRKSLEMPEK